MILEDYRAKGLVPVRPAEVTEQARSEKIQSLGFPGIAHFSHDLVGAATAVVWPLAERGIGGVLRGLVSSMLVALAIGCAHGAKSLRKCTVSIRQFVSGLMTIKVLRGRFLGPKCL